jgi:hypothetical protein
LPASVTREQWMQSTGDDADKDAPLSHREPIREKEEKVAG